MRQLFPEHPWIRRHSQLDSTRFDSIIEHLQQLLVADSQSIRRTHFFHGRYENLYLSSDSHPALDDLMTEAKQIASGILRRDENELAVGFWFNLMPPGHITTLHRHDDDDELLSGVVYLQVPENSGNLIIHYQGKECDITPAVGDYVFFDPGTPHAVAENKSGLDRVSIGMNFGLKLTSSNR